MILITGASGTVGRAVLAEVARSGQKHRAMYRSKGEAAKAPAGTEAVIADFSDKASLTAALRGVETVYLVCSPIPDLAPQGGRQAEGDEDGALHSPSEQFSAERADVLCAEHSGARCVLRRDGECADEIFGCEGHCGGAAKVLRGGAH